METKYETMYERFDVDLIPYIVNKTNQKYQGQTNPKYLLTSLLAGETNVFTREGNCREIATKVTTKDLTISLLKNMGIQKQINTLNHQVQVLDDPSEILYNPQENQEKVQTYMQTITDQIQSFKNLIQNASQTPNYQRQNIPNYFDGYCEQENCQELKKLVENFINLQCIQRLPNGIDTSEYLNNPEFTKQIDQMYNCLYTIEKNKGISR